MDNIQEYLDVFRKLFPPDAGYVHDELNLRTELSEQQRANEPLNADSHLTFMGGGLDNSASYELRGNEPVWFVELDGVHVGGSRSRRTTVVAYSGEEEAARMQVRVPRGPSPDRRPEPEGSRLRLYRTSYNHWCASTGYRSAGSTCLLPRRRITRA